MFLSVIQELNKTGNFSLNNFVFYDLSFSDHKSKLMCWFLTKDKSADKFHMHALSKCIFQKKLFTPLQKSLIFFFYCAVPLRDVGVLGTPEFPNFFLRIKPGIIRQKQWKVYWTLLLSVLLYEEDSFFKGIVVLHQDPEGIIIEMRSKMKF